MGGVSLQDFLFGSNYGLMRRIVSINRVNLISFYGHFLCSPVYSLLRLSVSKHKYFGKVLEKVSIVSKSIPIDKNFSLLPCNRVQLGEVSPTGIELPVIGLRI